jgi:HEAT repeat protein
MSKRTNFLLSLVGMLFVGTSTGISAQTLQIVPEKPYICDLKNLPPGILTPETVAERERTDASDIAALRSQLKSSKAEDHQRAADSISLFGQAARSLTPDLIENFNSPDIVVRGYAAGSFRWIGNDGAAAVPYLVKLLRDPDIWVRGQAAEGLGGMPQCALVAVPDLVNLLNDSNRFVRASAADALGNLAWEPGNLGESTNIALTQLLRLLKDQDAQVRGASVRALERLGGLSLLDLKLLLTDKDPMVRMSVVQAIGSMGERGKTAIPELIPLLQDSNESVRRNTNEVLNQFGYKKLN